MNPTAIHQAVRLSKSPKEMAWLCQPNAPLPKDVTDLLELCASKESLAEFAEKNHTEADQLQDMLLNFIDKVLLTKENPSAKQLGLNEDYNKELCELHYQLLLNIYQPSNHDVMDASEKSAQITIAYEALQAQAMPSEYKNIRISQAPLKSFYDAEPSSIQQAPTNITAADTSPSKVGIKNAFFAMLAITIISAVWMGGYLYEPEAPAVFAQESAPLNSNSDTVNDANVLPAPLTGQTVANQTTVKNVSYKQDQFQSLLENIEVAYEKGNVAKIQHILNSPEIKQQSNREVSAKLKKLFKITSERKMLLYDFDWTNLSGNISGKGKFLSRYHLKAENQWLTREGVASIIANQDNKGTLEVISLKLDNKNIDQ